MKITVKELKKMINEAVTTALHSRDDIDADRDDKVEKARRAFKRTRDNADSDRDYKLKRRCLKEAVEKFTEDDIDILSPKDYLDRWGMEGDLLPGNVDPNLTVVKYYTWREDHDPITDFDIVDALEGCKLSNGTYYVFSTEDISREGSKVPNEKALIKALLDSVNT